MQQLEIEYFFPLTEQIKLDLDFTTSEQYEKEKQEKLISGTFLLAGSGIGIGTTWNTLPTTTTIARINL